MDTIQLMEAYKNAKLPLKQQTNLLKEACHRQPEVGDNYFNALVERANKNPLYQMMLKEGLTSDEAGALGAMHSEVIKAAYPKLTGREFVFTDPTTETLVRYPKAAKAKAYKTAEGVSVWITGEKYDVTDVLLNIEIKAGGSWSRKFLEDAKWNVMKRQMAEVGRAVGQAETSLINTYVIANAGTTGTAKGAISWTNFVNMWTTLSALDMPPNVVALDPFDIGLLWQDDKFINGFYFGDQVDVKRGILGSTYLGVKIITSSLFTNHTYLAVDSEIGIAMPIRRELMVEPFEDPANDKYGVIATERIGLGVTRATAVLKWTY